MTHWLPAGFPVSVAITLAGMTLLLFAHVMHASGLLLPRHPSQAAGVVPAQEGGLMITPDTQPSFLSFGQ